MLCIGAGLMLHGQKELGSGVVMAAFAIFKGNRSLWFRSFQLGQRRACCPLRQVIAIADHFPELPGIDALQPLS